MGMGWFRGAHLYRALDFAPQDVKILCDSYRNGLEYAGCYSGRRVDTCQIWPRDDYRIMVASHGLNENGAGERKIILLD